MLGIATQAATVAAYDFGAIEGQVLGLSTVVAISLAGWLCRLVRCTSGCDGMGLPIVPILVSRGAERAFAH